jgi:O-antigen/teichoic acid export membrane protein
MILQGGLRLARLLSLAVAAYVLDTAGFAAVAIALALTDLARASLLAFDVSAVRARAGSPHGAATMEALTGAKSFMAVLLAMASIAIGLVLYGPLVAVIAAILSIGVVPGVLASLWMVPTQVDLRLLSMSPAVLLAAAITVVASTLGAATGGSIGFAVGLLLGEVALCGLVSIRVRYMPDLRPSRLYPVLAESPRLMLQQLGYAGQFRFGTLVLGLVATPLAVAEYSIASRLAEGLVILSTAITATSYPLMARARASGGPDAVVTRFVSSYWLAVGTSVTLVCLLILSVPIWLGVLFPTYPGAAIPFALVGVAVTLFFASGQTTALLNTWQQDTAAAGAAVLGLCVNVVGTLLLASPVGAIGVAASRLAGEAARLGWETFTVGHTGPAEVGRAWAAWVVFGPLLVTTAVAVASDWAVGVSILATVVGCTVAAIAGRSFRPWPRGGEPVTT